MKLVNLLTRRDAKASDLTRYFTGKACPRGHITERLVSSWRCVTCHIGRARSKRRVNGSLHLSRITNNKANRQRRRKAGYKNLADRLRSRLNRAISKGCRAGSAVRDLGCPIPEFREYIAAKFQPGMTWDNHGEWHLDHIRPLSSFDLTNQPQFLAACHFTNYQPLWAKDNLVKGSRWTA